MQQPECEKVDQLGPTEKTESHTEANNATKDANKLLQNYDEVISPWSKASILGSKFGYKRLCENQSWY